MNFPSVLSLSLLFLFVFQSCQYAASGAKTDANERTPSYCKKDDFELEAFLTAFAENIEAQKILYGSEALSDCSGMFIRLTRALAEECPAYQYPDASRSRSSRAIARWFYDQENLEIVENASEVGQKIKPGMVMFFGRSGKLFEDITIDQLTASSGIEHVGVVTEVKKDDTGKVIAYTLFHGRSSGKIASRTTYHQLQPSRSELPVFGNWNQQLVAMGFVLTPQPKS